MTLIAVPSSGTLFHKTAGDPLFTGWFTQSFLGKSREYVLGAVTFYVAIYRISITSRCVNDRYNR